MARLVGETLTLTLPGIAPDAWLTGSQPPPLVVVGTIENPVAPLMLVTDSVWAGGTVPPMPYVNVSAPGDTPEAPPEGTKKSAELLPVPDNCTEIGRASCRE